MAECDCTKRLADDNAKLKEKTDNLKWIIDMIGEKLEDVLASVGDLADQVDKE